MTCVTSIAGMVFFVVPCTIVIPAGDSDSIRPVNCTSLLVLRSMYFTVSWPPAPPAHASVSSGTRPRMNVTRFMSDPSSSELGIRSAERNASASLGSALRVPSSEFDLSLIPLRLEQGLQLRLRGQQALDSLGRRL